MIHTFTFTPDDEDATPRDPGAPEAATAGLDPATLADQAALLDALLDVEPTVTRDAAHWRALVATLAAAGLDVAQLDSPGRAVADALLLLRERRGHAGPYPTDYVDTNQADTLHSYDITTLDTAAGPVTVGYTDADELTIAVEPLNEVHVFPLDLVVAQVLAHASPAVSARAARRRPLLHHAKERIQ